MTMNWLEPLLQVWELSDIDRDGMLDKDEFAVVGLVLTDAFYSTRTLVDFSPIV